MLEFVHLGCLRERRRHTESRVYSTDGSVWDVYFHCIASASVKLRYSGCESERASVRTWYCFVCKYKLVLL